MDPGSPVSVEGEGKGWEGVRGGESCFSPHLQIAYLKSYKNYLYINTQWPLKCASFITPGLPGVMNAY